MQLSCIQRRRERMLRSSLLSIVLIMFVSAAGAEKLPVTVSITPQKYFVERIAGDLAEVTVMVPPGGNPHLFEPRPSQMVALGRSTVYFAIGMPFEAAWLPRFQGANPNLRIVHTDHGIEKIPMEKEHGREEEEHGHEHGHGHGQEEHGHKEEGHAHAPGEPDPHVWLSPETVRIIAANVRDGLQEVDPGNARIYAENHAAFARELDALHAEIQGILSGVRKRSFMVFHPAWGYFARTYGLEEIPIEVSGSEPSPRELARLIKVAQQEGVSAVFVQPQFSRKSAETIARQIDAAVVTADPLAEGWAANLLRVAESFRRAME
jgi:zinc transport system substrate-binding protein